MRCVDKRRFTWKEGSYWSKQIKKFCLYLKLMIKMFQMFDSFSCLLKAKFYWQCHLRYTNLVTKTWWKVLWMSSSSMMHFRSMIETQQLLYVCSSLRAWSSLDSNDTSQLICYATRSHLLRQDFSLCSWIKLCILAHRLTFGQELAQISPAHTTSSTRIDSGSICQTVLSKTLSATTKSQVKSKYRYHTACLDCQ